MSSTRRGSITVGSGIDAGSVYSAVRVDLAKLKIDMQGVSNLFDQFAIENQTATNRITEGMVNSWRKAISGVAEELNLTTQLVESGAISEKAAIETQIAERQKLLAVITQNAIARGKYTTDELAQYKQINTEIIGLTGKLDTMGKKGVFEGMKEEAAGALTSLVSLTAVIEVIRKTIDYIGEAENAYFAKQDARAKLDQIIKDTGASAWTSSAKIASMAESLEKTTTYGDDTIETMQGVLLGFKNIKGDNFTAASKAVLDMATVMKMDLTSAAQAVGKALDDPINGMDSLSRQGFKFTAQEKELLAALVKSGDQEKAQKVILEALSSAYGGTSEAVAQTAKGTKEQLGNALDNMNAQIGKFISRPLTALRKAFIELANANERGLKILMGDTELDNLNKTIKAWQDKTTAEKNDTATIVAYHDALVDVIKYNQELIDTGKLGNDQRLEALKTNQAYYRELDKIKSAYGPAIAATEAAAAADAKKAKAAAAALAAEKQAAEITEARGKIEKDYADSVALIDDKVSRGLLTETEGREELKKVMDTEIDALEKLKIQYKLSDSSATVKTLASQTDAEKALTAAIEAEAAAEEDEQKHLEAVEKIIADARKEIEDKDAATKKANSATEDQISKYDLQIKALTEQNGLVKDSILLEEQHKIADVESSEASVDEKEKAIAKIKELYAILKDKSAIEAAKKAQNELWSQIGSTAKKVFSSITAAYQSSISKQLSALEDQYNKQEELIEYDGKTKKQYLEDEVAAELAAGQTTKAAATQKELDEYNLEVEYNKKKAELEYQSNMASWEASLVNITISTAEGIARALYDYSWPYNLIVGGLVSAAGIAEYAAAAAAKPVAPSYETGGIVLGSSYSGDNIQANVNSGEMILTRAQQAALFNAISSGKIGGGDTIITVQSVLDGQVVAESTARRIRNGNVRIKG
jgi:hypothetical protein